MQPGQPTIQGELSDAIERVTGERVLPQGSGRTDAGVHALGQVASFPLNAPIPPANLMRALNRALPESIRVLAAEIAPPGFHARHSAIEKTYEYRIFRGEICPPTLARFVYAFNWPLNLEAMTRGCRICSLANMISLLSQPTIRTSAAVKPGCLAQNCVRNGSRIKLDESRPANSSIA